VLATLENEIDFLCPTEEDSGICMSLVMVNVRMCGQKGGKGDVGGQVRGLKMGQLILSMGPARAEVPFFVQRATIPGKRVFLYL
jgi:hypothetical protein